MISNHGVTRDHVAGLLLWYKFMVTKYVTERATTLITQRTGECLEDVDELWMLSFSSTIASGTLSPVYEEK